MRKATKNSRIGFTIGEIRGFNGVAQGKWRSINVQTELLAALRVAVSQRLNLSADSPHLRDGTMVNEAIADYIRQEGGAVTPEQVKESLSTWSDEEKREILLLLSYEVFMRGEIVQNSNQVAMLCLKKLLNGQAPEPPEIIKLAGLLEVDPTQLQTQIQGLIGASPDMPEPKQKKRKAANGEPD